MSSTQNHKIIVYISVLNWNKADDTLVCIEHLLKSNLPKTTSMQIYVVDNGSSDADYQKLSTGLLELPIHLIRLENNLGFSGGHNKIMQLAIDDNVDYVWLVNNDGLSLPDTLSNLILAAEQDPKIGAVSPKIISRGDNGTVDFCGAYHDWNNFLGVRLTVDQKESDFAEQDLWLVGAACLFRVNALKDVGLLEDRYFAYFEDNEISTKLAFSGWKNKVALDAIFLHDIPTQRQPYFYYLMARNELFFWPKYTPNSNKLFVTLKILERSIYLANKLLLDGEQEKSKACLLGCWDGLFNNYGKPNVDSQRKVPYILEILRRILFNRHMKYIKTS